MSIKVETMETEKGGLRRGTERGLPPFLAQVPLVAVKTREDGFGGRHQESAWNGQNKIIDAGGKNRRNGCCVSC